MHAFSSSFIAIGLIYYISWTFSAFQLVCLKQWSWNKAIRFAMQQEKAKQKKLIHVREQGIYNFSTMNVHRNDVILIRIKLLDLVDETIIGPTNLQNIACAIVILHNFRHFSNVVHCDMSSGYYYF